LNFDAVTERRFRGCRASLDLATVEKRRIAPDFRAVQDKVSARRDHTDHRRFLNGGCRSETRGAQVADCENRSQNRRDRTRAGRHWTKYTFGSHFSPREIIVIQVYYVSRTLAVAALCVLAVAGVHSIRLALADAAFREHTPQSVARALEILPDHAGYLLFRAQQMIYDGEDSTALLERAARLNPLSSAPRIRLGLAAEARGDFSGAEKWLLDAARVDRQFEPRWTLANFYFRRERRSDFWKWMRPALEVSYGDRSLAFDLCWRMTQNAEEVLAQAVPERHEVLAAYLYYVMDRRHEAVAPVALKLAQLHDRSDAAELETASDLLINDGRFTQARELWMQMVQAQTGLIANGDFVTEPSGHGFDWRPTRGDGVTHVALPGSYRIQLSGKQSESTELLRQLVVLQSGKVYSLRWEARTQGFGSPTGIEWNAGATHAALEAGTMNFKAEAAFVPITLAYHRPTGQARAEDPSRSTALP
jgi:tetratricopeptide (TPR) repeat protein